MRYIFLLSLFFVACDSGSFDKDKRQIMAKDFIHSQLPPHSSDFDITSFKEDTMQLGLDTFVKHPIRYTIYYRYTDSTGNRLEKRGEVIFAPGGHSVLYSIPDQTSSR